MSKFKELLKIIGPGILFAGAAVGVSHLVQSTRAGAEYGWQLIIFVLMANLFKYPFFQFGHRYIAATGNTLIDGYKSIGKWAVITFFLMNIITAVISTAGVTIVTAGLLGNFLNLFFGLEIKGLDFLSVIIIAFSIILILFGKYKVLDLIVKILIVVLSISTITAFFLALAKGSNAQANFIPPAIFNEAGLVFLIGLMGWMPAPIEASVWTSIWTKEKNKNNKTKPNFGSLLTDFNIGYIGTAILAMFFVGLGALVMYGTGNEFSNSGIAFSAQLVELYTTTLGTWAMPIISIVALATMISTTLTVIDAYPRSLYECLSVLKLRISKKKYLLFLIILVVSVLALLIIVEFKSKMLDLILLATIVSFIAAPIFSLLNYRVVSSKYLPKDFHLSNSMKLLSYLGLIFLFGFTFVYIYTLMIV